MLAALPEELILHVASALDASSLATFQQICHRFVNAETPPLWRLLCERRWKQRPRFALTPAREAWLKENLALSWQQRYIFFEHDAARSAISSCELNTLEWTFNFAQAAGGCGPLSRQRARFVDDGDNRGRGELHLAGYPPLPYRLEPEDTAPASQQPDSMVARAAERWFRPLTLIQQMMQSLALGAAASAEPAAPQTLLIANFPPHNVQRLEAEWEWMIFNDNVTFVSAHFECDSDDTSTHPELGPRHF